MPLQAHVASADIEYVRDAAANVAAELDAKPELAEPDVPKTILRLNELLKAPGASARRAAFAMLPARLRT